jgi:putative aminopeptidase FrvX
VALVLGVVAPALWAQSPGEASALAERLAAMTAVSGYEHAVTDSLLQLLPGFARDRGGNLVLRIGQGTRRRLLACGIDEPGWVVGGVRPDGYLTLRRVGAPSGPVADQQLEGSRVTVFGRRGAVPGVVGVRSIHLTRGRAPTGDAPFPLDEALVDVGAASAADARALGLELLSPVSLAKRPHRYGADLLAAPAAGGRGACAALVTAARRVTAEAGMMPGGTTTVVAIVVEQRFTGRGLAAVKASLGPFDETMVIDGSSLSTRYAGWPVETVALGDVERLTTRLIDWIGGRH